MRNDQVTAFPAIRLAENSQADTPAELCCRKLKELSDRLDQFHAFGKGQFVKWKSGLKNRKFPDYGEPAIVTAVLPSPVFDPSEVSSASPYFQEPLSIIIGTYRDDDFLEFRVDGRRFRAVRILNLSGASDLAKLLPPGLFSPTNASAASAGGNRLGSMATERMICDGFRALSPSSDALRAIATIVPPCPILGGKPHRSDARRNGRRVGSRTENG